MKQKSPTQIRNLIDNKILKILDLFTVHRGLVNDVVDEIDGLLFELEDAYEDRKNNKKQHKV